jgi:PPOX class probable F420-dependent enzyme
MSSLSTPFDDYQYISLATFKKDGTPVPTPVWCAPLDGNIVVFTLRETYKVKRLRNDPRVRVARCDVRGKGEEIVPSCDACGGPRTVSSPRLGTAIDSAAVRTACCAS